MICHGRLFSSLFLSLLLVLTACGKGKPGWGEFPVPIYSDSAITTYPQAQSDLQDAMAFWEAQSGSKLFDYRGTYEGGSAYTGSVSSPSSIVANVIFFQNPWHLATSIVGQTVVSSSTDAAIKSAMILINGSASFCWGECYGQGNQTSARKTFTHELGHFLGMTHNTQDVNDIMYPQITPGGSLSSVHVNATALQAVTP